MADLRNVLTFLDGWNGIGFFQTPLIRGAPKAPGRMQAGHHNRRRCRVWHGRLDGCERHAVLLSTRWSEEELKLAMNENKEVATTDLELRAIVETVAQFHGLL